ncbi:MAG: hypothetical protein P9F75_02280 [Candidatus Contendobacter sp.]|nr:hypothetical protein [Candidatus Contendobacter sp.]
MEIPDQKTIDFYTRQEYFKEKKYRLKSFGSLIGLRFAGDFGHAEIIMGYPEINRILDLVAAIEKEKTEPDATLLAAIDNVKNHVMENTDYSIVADVVIGSGRIDVTPDFNDKRNSNKR